MPSYFFREYDPLLDSSNMGFKEWIKIARDIRDNYDNFDGFVILHGTDTMAYTASALSFMLENLSKPVVLTGSQIPFCEIRNDARDNLITSIMIAAEPGLSEVCIYFGNTLLRGNRATKSSTYALNAFESPNYPPLGSAGVSVVISAAIKKSNNKKINLFEFEEQQIAVLKMFPGMQPEILESIITSNLKGLVLEAFGAGNISNVNENLKSIFKRAIENGTVIIVCSQCLRGNAIIGEYEASKGLSDVGAISGFDITVEAAVAKLYYLLSKKYTKDVIKRLMITDLRGEMSSNWN
jgi:L-asparaginase